MTFTPEQIRERAALVGMVLSPDLQHLIDQYGLDLTETAAMLRAGADALAREQARDVNVEASLASMQEAVENMKAIVEGKA